MDDKLRFKKNPKKNLRINCTLVERTSKLMSCI